MNLLAIPDIVMGGITLYVGLTHLLQWVRRREGTVDLHFALTCLAMALYDFFTAGLYNASTLSESVFWVRGQLAMSSFVGLCFLGFVISYTGSRLRVIPALLSAYLAASIPVFIFARSPLVLNETAPVVRHPVLPGFQRFAVFEPETGVFTNIHYLFGIAVFFLIFAIGLAYYRSRDRSRGRALLVSAAFFFAGVLNDMGVSAGLFTTPYLMEYAFFAIVFFMANALSREFLSMAGVQSALIESEERFRGIVELSPYPVAIIDADQRFEYFNPRFIEVFGYTRDDLADVTAWFQAAYPNTESREKAVRSWTPALKHPGSKTVGRREFTVTCKNGATRDIIFRLYIMQDGKSFVIFDDITDRKQAMTELIESKENYRLIYENASEAIYALDMDMRIRNISPSIERILGYRPAELIGTRVTDLPVIAPQSRAAIERDVSGVFTGSTIRAAEYRLITKRGVPLFVEMSMSPLLKDGRITGMVSIMRDISERKKMEVELLKASKIESLGIFAGGIAHDFNNLLTAIVGNLSLARSIVTKNHEIEDILHDAEKASLRAKDLTHQLLTFSRGGLPIRKAAIIENMVRDTASFVLRGSGLRCDFDLPADLWHAEIDEGQISQVIHNIVLNARQAMNNGVVILRAANAAVAPDTVPGLNPGRYIRIEIVDQGTGIPESVLPYIFDPYYTTKTEGSGLGLSVSYSIIKNHGGAILVDTRAGMGTAFSVFIPASHDSADREQGRPAGIRPPGGRILVMDDEEIVLKIAERMLRKLGFETERAMNGEEAIVRYRKALESGRPFDLVIMDLTIPGQMGGAETLTKLKNINPAVRAVVSSGYSNDPVMARYGDYGFVGVIAKPYRFEDVSETVGAVLA